MDHSSATPVLGAVVIIPQGIAEGGTGACSCGGLGALTISLDVIRRSERCGESVCVSEITPSEQQQRLLFIHGLL